MPTTQAECELDLWIVCDEGTVKKTYHSRREAQRDVNSLYTFGHITRIEWLRHTDFLSSVDSQCKTY